MSGVQATTAATVPYVRPTTLAVALETCAAHPNWLVLAGGTDAMLDPSATNRPGVVDLFAVAELHRIDIANGTIRIGACATYAEMLGSNVVREHLPLLHAAVTDVAAVQIRGRGTIGGNLVTASPVGDMFPGLLALDATVVVGGTRGQRRIPCERFIAGFRRVDLAPGELLTAIEIPVPRPGTVQYWRKVGTRAAQSIAKLSLAAVACVEDGRLSHVRLACGGIADRPVRLHAVEDVARGAVPDATLADRVRVAVGASITPITDARSTAVYRRDVTANLAARFILDLAG